MIRLIIYWLLSALAILFLSKVIPGGRVKNFGTALMVSGVYGILHVLLSKVLIFLAFIPVLLSFGLFIFIINAFILYIPDKLIEDFEIDHFLTTILAAVFLTLANGLTRWMV